VTADLHFITVAITDNGTGVSPEILPVIFERGISGSGGTGLGLPICKNIIENHGGTIEVESPVHLDRACKVIFTIPIYSAEVHEND
jgi:signal transduction histidine kinase